MKIEFDANKRQEVEAVYNMIFTLYQGLYPDMIKKILVPKNESVDFIEIPPADKRSFL